MPTITIVNSKGGVGKTTTSIFLAAAAQNAGHNVTLIDADPQGSATEWFQDAEDADPNATHDVNLTLGNVATLSRTTAGDSITIIDTPPGHARIIDAAITAADFVVIPCLPSMRDMPRVWQVLDTIPSETPTAVLFVSVNAQARMPEAARSALEQEDVSVFPTEIPQWEVFRQVGKWPAPGSRGTQHYETIFTQIMEVLGQ